MVNVGYQRIGIGRNDRERPTPLTGGFPILPQATDAKGPVVLHRYDVGPKRYG